MVTTCMGCLIFMALMIQSSTWWIKGRRCWIFRRCYTADVLSLFYIRFGLVLERYCVQYFEVSQWIWEEDCIYPDCNVRDGGSVNLLEHWPHQPKWRGWKNFNMVLFIFLDSFFIYSLLGMYYAGINVFLKKQEGFEPLLWNLLKGQKNSTTSLKRQRKSRRK
jgi:hypothetical protein